MQKLSMISILTFILLSSVTSNTYAYGSRNTAEITAMEKFSEGRRGVVCWVSRRNNGACRIWACDFNGSNLRQVSPNEKGYDHIAPLIRPDGTGIIYLRTPTFINTEKYSNKGSFYADLTGDIMLVDANDTDGSSARLLRSKCRSIFEWRVAAWMDKNSFAYIAENHHGYVYSIDTKENKKVFSYPNSTFGALPNPQLTHCIDGENRLFKINNAGPNGTCTQLFDYNGCQGSLSRDGTIAYRTEGATPRSLVAMPLNDVPKEWDMVPPQQFPSTQNYLYFPRLSWSQEFAVCGASDGGHSHWAADYDIFVLPMNPNTKTPTGKAVKYSFGTTTSGICLDAWPDVWVSTETVNPKVGAVKLSPAVTSIAKGKSISFTATITNQFGNPFKGPITWSTNGGGVLTPSTSTTNASTHTSQFVSNGTEGTFTITARSEDLWTTSSVTVVDPSKLHLKINCGTSTAEVQGWEPGSKYLITKGADYLFSGPANVTGVANAGPASIYTTVCHRNHSYSFPQIPNGEYVVRIHFYDESSNDSRAMNYSIEGKTVLEKFSIFAEAGQTRKALVKEFIVSVSDGNGIQIVANMGSGDDAFEAGIEILGADQVTTLAEIQLLSPSGGETFAVGDVIKISWKTDGNGGDEMVVNLIVDGVKSFQLNLEGTIKTRSDSTGSFEWKVGPLRDDASPISDNLVIEIADYQAPEINDHSKKFSIVAKSSSILPKSNISKFSSVKIRASITGALFVAIPFSGNHTTKIINMRGKTLVTFFGNGATMHEIPTGEISSGSYLIKVKHSGGAELSKITIP